MPGGTPSRQPSIAQQPNTLKQKPDEGQMPQQQQQQQLQQLQQQQQQHQLHLQQQQLQQTQASGTLKVIPAGTR
jgi:hypothetical protein